MLLGISVFILFSANIFFGEFKLNSDEFQPLLQVSTSEDSSNTGYQGLSFMAGFVPLYLIGTMAETRRRATTQFFFIAITSLPVFYIGGRSALVGLLVAFCAWGILNCQSRHINLLKILASICALFLLLCLGVLLSDFLPLSLRRLLWLVDEDVQQSSMRFELWSAAIHLWLQSPSSLLFGHGPQQFPLLAGYDDAGMYPHNFVLELLSEHGLIGLSLFLSAPFYIILCQAKRGWAHFTKLKSPFFLVYYLTVLSFSGALESLWPLFFFVGWLSAESDCLNHFKTKSGIAKVIA
jgi:hypothetical protein